MKKLTYLPEAIGLFIYAAVAILIIQNSHTRELLSKQIATVTTLEYLIPQQTVEILNTNLNSNLHYDLYAQLQLEIENQTKHLATSSTSFAAIQNYNSLASSYMQLVTMLKTSRKLVAFNTDDSKSLHLRINNLLLKYSLAPNNELKTQIQALLINPSLDESLEQSGLSWQSVTQHINFILNNTDEAAILMGQLKASRINQVLAQEALTLASKYQENTLQTTRYYFIVILSFISIFLAVLLRQQSKLKTKSKQYKEAAEVKTRFLANMSHEIRTPLTGIIGLTELCQETQLSKIQQDYLHKLSFSAKSLLSIINDILDFSKIEAGKLNIEIIDFDHEVLFDNLYAMISKPAENKGLEIIYNIDPNALLWLKGDPIRIGQILLNLLSNAIKFTDEGNVVITVKLITESSSAEHISAEKHYVQYEVQDTGIGLTAEQTNKLFNRFEQADDSTTRKYGGTGLGLSICKSLTTLMKGDISVTSELGQGSTFTVTLPVLISDKQSNAVRDYRLVNNKSLLLLEDNPITQEVIKKMALHMGINTTVTSSVGSALAACDANSFDYALIDWHLPGESGSEFIRQYKSRHYQPNQIFLFSAFNLQQLEDMDNSLTNYQFLPKPITIAKLYQAFTCTETPSNINNITANNQPKAKIESTTQQEIEIDTHQPQVLLVEDNRINQTIAKTILTKLGLHIDIADDGLKALEKVKANQYDLILMDIRMPIMDGMETTIELRKHYSKDDLIIIAMTANVTKEEISHYLSIGMNGHLSKPYDKQAIEAELAKYLTIETGVLA